MNKLVAVFVIIAAITLTGCKKEDCVKEFSKHVGSYMVRDSAVYSSGKTIVRTDTIYTEQVAGWDNKFVFRNFGVDSATLIVDDYCPATFKLVELSVGNGYIYTGNGSFNGNNFSINVHMANYLWKEKDSIDQFCTGVKL